MDVSKPMMNPLTPADATAKKPLNPMKVAGAKGASMEKIEATAKEFESQFISQMLSAMFATRDAKEGLGGSEEEETYESFLIQEYGKVISRAGGIGIADQIKQSMLKLQEVEKPHAPAAATPTA